MRLAPTRHPTIALAALVATAGTAASAPGPAPVCWHPQGNVAVTPGDLSGDGQVRVSDAICTILVSLSESAGTSPPHCLATSMQHADVDCSGQVDVEDVLLVVHLAMAMPLPSLLDATGDGCADACEPCAAPGEGSCLIAQQCVPEGGVAPDAPCQACEIATSATAWTEREDGASCGDSMHCEAGMCVPAPSGPTDVLIWDDFEGYAVGTFPSAGGWTIRYNGAGNHQQYITDVYANGGDKSFRLHGVQSWDARIINALPYIPDVVYFEASFFSSSISHTGSFGLHNPTASTWGSTRIGGSFVGGVIRVGGHDLLTYDPTIWNTVRVKADFSLGLLSVWINGEAYLIDHPHTYPSFNHTHFQFTARNQGTNIVYYDDVMVWVE